MLFGVVAPKPLGSDADVSNKLQENIQKNTHERIEQTGNITGECTEFRL